MDQSESRGGVSDGEFTGPAVGDENGYESSVDNDDDVSSDDDPDARKIDSDVSYTTLQYLEY